MPKTTEEAFVEFHSRLTPSASETDAAKRHRASIEECLQRNTGLVRFFRSGSFGHGTSIRWYSDVDYFAWIPHDRISASSKVMLEQVRSALDAKFPNTNVHIDEPAVVVPFGSDASESTEVVPAGYERDLPGGKSVFRISNGSGGWMPSSPEQQAEYVNVADDALKKKVKPLIRFIKAWNFYKAASISSYYLETWVAKYAKVEKTIWYGIDVGAVFRTLSEARLEDLPDPTGIGGSIKACGSDYQRLLAAEKVTDAKRAAASANSADSEGKISLAFAYWNTVFDGNFPSYG